MAKTKVLALIDNDPRLAEICRSADERLRTQHTHLKLLQKQMKAAKEKLYEENKVGLEEIRHYLQSKGIITEWKPTQMHLTYDLQENSVSVCDHGPGGTVDDGPGDGIPIHSIIAQLFGRD